MRREEIFRMAGREFSPEEMALIREVVESCGGLSRTELANTLAGRLTCDAVARAFGMQSTPAADVAATIA